MSDIKYLNPERTQELINETKRRLGTKQDTIQVSTLPTASADYVGEVYQYIGVTGNGLTHNYFYECSADTSTTPPTYSWVQTNVQTGGSGQSIQYETMPTAEFSRAGDIIQYVGTDTNDYKNGYFYKCVEKSGQYVWESITTQASDKTKITHFEVMPTASAEYDNIAVQYIGNDTEYFIHNYFYECRLDENGQYYWRNTPVQGDSYWKGTTARFNAEKDNIPIGTIIYITDTDRNEDPYAQYTFANSTPEQMALMLAANDRGDININDYWKIGDTKVVPVADIAAGWDDGNGEAFSARNISFTIMDTEYQGNDIHFVISMTRLSAAGGAAPSGYMNSTDTSVGGWKECARRKWCNEVFYSALPSGFRSLLLPITVKTPISNNSYDTTTDYIILPTITETSDFYRSAYEFENERTLCKTFKMCEGSYQMTNSFYFSTWFRTVPSHGDDANERFGSASSWRVGNVGQLASANVPIVAFGCI